MSPARKLQRDLEKAYSAKDFATKLRRFADAVENGKSFKIQIAGERVSVPAGAVFNIEHERGKTKQEVEFQIKWAA